MVELHSDSLYRTAYRIVRKADEAEDICQRAYVKAIGAESQVSDPARLRGWLTQVVVNESLTVLRRRKIEGRAMQVRAETGPEPHRSAEPRLDDTEFIASLLDQLDEQTRTVVVMRTMQGLSGNEVKRELGCSAASVSKRLHRGLSQLRALAHEALHAEVTP